jgi:hypothetical protein
VRTPAGRRSPGGWPRRRDPRRPQAGRRARTLLPGNAAPSDRGSRSRPGARPARPAACLACACRWPASASPAAACGRAGHRPRAASTNCRCYGTQAAPGAPPSTTGQPPARLAPRSPGPARRSPRRGRHPAASGAQVTMIRTITARSSRHAEPAVGTGVPWSASSRSRSPWSLAAPQPGHLLRLVSSPHQAPCPARRRQEAADDIDPSPAGSLRPPGRPARAGHLGQPAQPVARHSSWTRGALFLDTAGTEIPLPIPTAR